MYSTPYLNTFHAVRIFKIGTTLRILDVAIVPVEIPTLGKKKIFRASAFKCCFFMDFQANQNRPSGFNQNKIYGNLNSARYDGVKS